MDGGAESPQETVARLVLIDAGLPPPSTQVEIYGEYGEFIARVDMAYEEVKVAIEYDGAQHWENPAVRQRDIDRQFALTALGWFVVRVSRDLLKYRGRPTSIEWRRCSATEGWCGEARALQIECQAHDAFDRVPSCR